MQVTACASPLKQPARSTLQRANARVHCTYCAVFMHQLADPCHDSWPHEVVAVLDLLIRFLMGVSGFRARMSSFQLRKQSHVSVNSKCLKLDGTLRMEVWGAEGGCKRGYQSANSWCFALLAVPIP